MPGGLTSKHFWSPCLTLAAELFLPGNHSNGFHLSTVCAFSQCFTASVTRHNESGVCDKALKSVVGFAEADGIRHGPGTAIQVHGRSATRLDPSSTLAFAKSSASRAYSGETNSLDTEIDTDSLKKFIKLKVCFRFCYLMS